MTRPACGTPQGYRAHLDRKQQTCQPCRDAEARRQAAVRAGKQCGATDGADLEGGPYGRCTLKPGHQTGGWHQEWRANGVLRDEWRGPAPGERCDICGKDGSEH